MLLDLQRFTLILMHSYCLTLHPKQKISRMGRRFGLSNFDGFAALRSSFGDTSLKVESFVYLFHTPLDLHVNDNVR